MKLVKLLLLFFISIVLVIGLAKPGLNQSGTQSDITVPNPLEINPQPVETPPNHSQSSLSNIRIDRNRFDQVFEQATDAQAVQLFEELQAVEFGKYFGVNFYGSTITPEKISQTLCNLGEITGKKAAVIYVVSLAKELELLLILPNSQACTKGGTKQNNYESSIVRQRVPEANREIIQKIAKEFRANVTDSTSIKNYLNSAKQLYQWIISPLEQPLLEHQIDSLIFCMDNGLRSIPMAALSNDKQFLIEQYSVSLIPSFSLTDTRYVPIVNSSILAMGISQSTQQQSPLPAVALEVPTLVNTLWQGQAFLNEESTLAKLQSVNLKRHFDIIHIATHAEFNAGKVSASYIQFWNEKLRLDELKGLSQKLGWYKSPKVEMLVLSACRTALGNEQAELGFAGLAVQAGVKTAVGSLWYASDEGSLALMTEFYHKLRTAPSKTEAMREAQLGMIKGEVRLENGQLVLSNGQRFPLPPELADRGDLSLSHPYFWSGYTIIGNWN